MPGEDIPKTRCAREEGRIKMSGTIGGELYRMRMLFGTLSGRTTTAATEEGGTREDISCEHPP